MGPAEMVRTGRHTDQWEHTRPPRSSSGEGIIPNLNNWAHLLITGSFCMLRTINIRRLIQIWPSAPCHGGDTIIQNIIRDELM